MHLDYAKKKMPVKQVFTQYSALRRPINADSQWNFYQKLWAANLQQEIEQTHKHISYLGLKGEVIEKIEEMSTQTLCSYGYAAYKQEYKDDWKEHLELYNDLKLASSESMDYRTCSKVWNKFINKLKCLVSHLTSHHDILLIASLYFSVEPLITPMSLMSPGLQVGSTILNDQGLQESGETEGVKGVSMPVISVSH